MSRSAFALRVIRGISTHKGSGLIRAVSRCSVISIAPHGNVTVSCTCSLVSEWDGHSPILYSLPHQQGLGTKRRNGGFFLWVSEEQAGARCLDFHQS